MQLYYAAGAPNPRRVLVYLAEKGLTEEVLAEHGTPLSIEPINIMKGEHKVSAYRTLSPLSQVPVLALDDGTAITETLAICRYFEALYPDPPLFGVEPTEIALIDMWQRRLELNFFMPVAMHFRHLHPAMAQLESQNKEWGELNKTRALKMMKFLDRSLKGREFIAGSYSIADVIGLTALDFATATRLPVPEEMANLRAYHERLGARPSAKAAP